MGLSHMYGGLLYFISDGLLFYRYVLNKILLVKKSTKKEVCVVDHVATLVKNINIQWFGIIMLILTTANYSN